eukprot:161330_1
MTEEQSQMIAQQNDVKFVVKDSIYTIKTDASPQFLELTATPNGAYANDINGEGVVIGILDTGIWPEHPSFFDDGSYSSPPTNIPTFIPCDFGNTDHNSDDLPFECNNKLIGARRCMNSYDLFVEVYNLTVGDLFMSARDDDSHGTHVASTAAGNNNVEAFTIHPLVESDVYGTISGIAHRAHIIAYKIFGELGAFGSDIAACIEHATMDNVDVLNYSGGGQPGYTFISSASSYAFLEATKKGIFTANSAGNSGNLGLTSPAGSPWVMSVAASTQTRTFGAFITVKEIFPHYSSSSGSSSSVTFRRKSSINGYGIIPTSSVSSTKSKWIQFINGGSCDSLDNSSTQGKIVLCKNDIFPSIPMIAQVREANGLGVIFWGQIENGYPFYRTPNDMLFAAVWLNEGQKMEDFINESNDANNILIKVVNSKTELEIAPSIADFSSRGPNKAAFDIIKPDITAPGVMILAGISPNTYSSSDTNLFATKAGTSMAAPHIAGIGALIKQFHPNWGADYIKSAIMTTSYRDGVVDTDLTGGDAFDYGSGHVNPGTDFNDYPTEQSVINPGLVYPTTENDYNSGLCEDSTAFTPALQVCEQLLSEGYTNLMRDMNQPNIGVVPLIDMVTVRRYVVSVASGTNHFEVEINEPNGIEIQVSPTVLELNENERGDYNVTFKVGSNAILHEFYFGYLVWKSNVYSVHSTIAVYPSNGSLLFFTTPIPPICTEYDAYNDVIRGEIECGATVSGTHNSSGNSVIYTFSVYGGSECMIVADTCFSDFDTGLGIHDSNGSLIDGNCNDDDCGIQSRITQILSADGLTEYWLKIGGYDGDTGNYVLNLTCNNCNAPTLGSTANFAALPETINEMNGMPQNDKKNILESDEVIVIDVASETLTKVRILFALFIALNGVLGMFYYFRKRKKKK